MCLELVQADHCLELLQRISKYFRDKQLILKASISWNTAPQIFIQMCASLQACLFLFCLQYCTDFFVYVAEKPGPRAEAKQFPSLPLPTQPGDGGTHEIQNPHVQGHNPQLAGGKCSYQWVTYLQGKAAALPCLTKKEEKIPSSSGKGLGQKMQRGREPRSDELLCFRLAVSGFLSSRFLVMLFSRPSPAQALHKEGSLWETFILLQWVGAATFNLGLALFSSGQRLLPIIDCLAWEVTSLNKTVERESRCWQQSETVFSTLQFPVCFWRVTVKREQVITQVRQGSISAIL